ncbi:MAG: hypothetical protein J6W30_06210 [Bacteroidales bacterium]|nr:hypothetical protein [Bacteroidales bacterium]
MVAIVFAATLTAYAQPANQARWNHYLDIGTAFYFEGQQDSAKVYLEQVFENNVEMKMTAARYLLDIALSEGDTPKINEYGLFLAENYDLSINQERQKSYRRIVFICVAALLLLLAMVWVLLRQRKTNTKQRQAYDQQRLSYDQQLNAAQSAIEKQAFENLQKQAKEILSKGNQRKRILEAFNSVYPHAYDRLRSTYPDLTEQEIDLLVLNFLEFRIKEEAEILELSQNTVMKYRSNLIKKVGKDPIPRLL